MATDPENELAQKALKDSENKYRILVETMNDGLGVVDKDVKLTYLNDRFTEMLGYSKDEMLEKSVVNFIFEDDKKSFIQEMNKRKNGEIEQYELRWIKKNGDILYSLISPKLINDELGNYNGSLGVIVDITERKESENRLLDLYKHLGLINRQISILLDVHKLTQDNVDQDKIKNFILVSSLGLSHAKVVAIYKHNETISNFELVSFLTENGRGGFNLKRISVEIPEIKKLFQTQFGVQGFSDIDTDKRHPLKSRFMHFLLLPLVKEKKVDGLLLIGFGERSNIDYRELDFFNAFAVQASFALYDAKVLS